MDIRKYLYSDWGIIYLHQLKNFPEMTRDLYWYYQWTNWFKLTISCHGVGSVWCALSLKLQSTSTPSFPSLAVGDIRAVCFGRV